MCHHWTNAIADLSGVKGLCVRPEMLDVRILPFWFKHSVGWRVWQESPSLQTAGLAKSGRPAASAIGKRAGQVPDSKRPAAKMCSQARVSFEVGANNGPVKDAQGVSSGKKRSNFKKIVGLLLKRSSPDLFWSLAVHHLKGNRYFRQHLLVDKKHQAQRRCPAMPAPV